MKTSRKLKQPTRNHLGCSNIFDISVRADGYALGKILINDEEHHAQFVRVRNSRHGEQVCDSDSDEATSNWGSICTLYDAAFRTMTLPGLKGRWVCVIHPFAV